MLRKLSIFFLIVFGVAGAIAAQSSPQTPNAAKPAPTPELEAESFTGPAKKFSIGLPREPFATIASPLNSVADHTNVTYKWVLREGVFFISNSTYEKDTFTSKELVDSYTASFLEELKRVTTFQIYSQKSITLGTYTGSEIVRGNKEGKVIIVRILASGKEAYTLTASPDETVDDAQTLMVKALDSFKLTEPAKTNN
ncbi:MAG TPA: hypothetical protein VGO50_11840 [Pyrinomonadaceae bacterium]|jgi:hypothetical protein|nr:hypothetical protein [Pyrinomonadaceae bacterium]